MVVTRTSDAKILFEFDCGSGRSLGVQPRSGGEKTETWFKGYTYNGGFEYSRRTGGKLTVVNVVDIEDYVKGVITYEMSADWPLEALKAQALCARTYVASYIGSSTYYINYGFDVTNDTYCQVYRGTNLSTACSDRAVDETAGVYITYDGEPISAMFSSSHGGGSEDSENITGGVTPYLRGVLDPYEAAAADLNSRSSLDSELFLLRARQAGEQGRAFAGQHRLRGGGALGHGECDRPGVHGLVREDGQF